MPASSLLVTDYLEIIAEAICDSASTSFLLITL
jgi:hypothetical protein